METTGGRKKKTLSGIKLFRRHQAVEAHENAGAGLLKEAINLIQ